MAPGALIGAAGGCAAPGRASAGATEAGFETIGHSREGRPLEAATFGAAARRIYIVGGIHGDEPEGHGVVAHLEPRLSDDGWPANVRLLRDMNPDGTAAGRRGNSAGVDLNRNWPAANYRPAGRRGAAALSEPEAAAAHADMTAFGPDVIIVLHSTGSGPFVNFDGPAGELAAAFASAAAALDSRWRVVADMGYPTPGSMGSYWGVDLGIPILTIEMARGEDSMTQVMAIVRGIEAVASATVASGFRPMPHVRGSRTAPSPIRTPLHARIARKGDATGASP